MSVLTVDRTQPGTFALFKTYAAYYPARVAVLPASQRNLKLWLLYHCYSLVPSLSIAIEVLNAT